MGLPFQAFWNWVEYYPDEFTMLYQRPQADMAGESSFRNIQNPTKLVLFVYDDVWCKKNELISLQREEFQLFTPCTGETLTYSLFFL